VVKEGDKVEVLVLSVDEQAQRVSLSMKALSQPEPAKKKDDSTEPETRSQPRRRIPPKQLKGGLGRASRGDEFGLKW
jgi:predicted RNA-binding protein with RPS1 domain